jgi:C4-dicarboxylate-specific signal transduction histidine kinase
MKIGRIAHGSAWCIVGLAALVLPCVTLVSANARARQARIAESIVAVRRLEWIERYACRVSGVPRTDPPDPTIVLQEDATEHATFERLAASLAASRQDPVFREPLARNVAAIREVERSGESGTAARSPEGTASLAGILERTDALKAAVRAAAMQDSKELATQWSQTNLLAVLSCALAVTLALLLFAYDRSVVDRTKAEEGEQELRAELAHVGRLSVVGEMGTKIAHELNQPLGAIQSYLAGCVRRLRQAGGDREDVIGALEQAMRETERASAIIHGLREFGRHSGGRFAPVEVNELVREVLPLLAAEFRENRIEPELDLAEGLERVHADRIQIEQVLVNLMRNSIEAMASTPADERRLIVRTSRVSGRMVEVLVEDTGCGLSSDLLPNLFQPFHTTKAKGMGIGLAISRTIVEAHEGTIRAEPRRGRGAVFRFQLPCPSMVVTA